MHYNNIKRASQYIANLYMTAYPRLDITALKDVSNTYVSSLDISSEDPNFWVALIDFLKLAQKFHTNKVHRLSNTETRIRASYLGHLQKVLPQRLYEFVQNHCIFTNKLLDCTIKQMSQKAKQNCIYNELETKLSSLVQKYIDTWNKSGYIVGFDISKLECTTNDGVKLILRTRGVSECVEDILFTPNRAYIDYIIQGDHYYNFNFIEPKVQALMEKHVKNNIKSYFDPNNVGIFEDLGISVVIKPLSEKQISFILEWPSDTGSSIQTILVYGFTDSKQKKDVKQYGPMEVINTHLGVE